MVANIDNMQKQPGTPQVPQELNAEANSSCGTFDQSGNICTHEPRTCPNIHDTEVRVQRRERIVCDLGPRCGDPREQRRFTSVWQAQKTHIGEHLKLKPDG